ncbi:nucleotidyltransferase domain-containing protein [Patescibacteria group bacterium]|nr:nucleotidyltransferase domain-containing protein [Patescibacteria group bacterium]MBU1256635.1 nucleotidyltransferase domain-containing protein [Patescibacteria group bacterium]MBU1457139.1 nucleotidyltransferase domain-containing protein [Patescibacteria group bacterium]
MLKKHHQIIHSIAKKYQPQQIIAYGSVAQNKAKSNSDLDLIVIKNTKKNFYDRIQSINKTFTPSIPTDIVVYTPKEFKNISRWSYFIQQEVLKKGQIVYDSQ